MSAKFGSIRPPLGRFRPKSAGCSQIWPTSARFRPNSAKFARSSIRGDRLRPNLGVVRPDLNELDQTWAHASQNWNDFDNEGVEVLCGCGRVAQQKPDTGVFRKNTGSARRSEILERGHIPKLGRRGARIRPHWVLPCHFLASSDPEIQLSGISGISPNLRISNLPGVRGAQTPPLLGGTSGPAPLSKSTDVPPLCRPGHKFLTPRKTHPRHVSPCEL